MQIETVVKNDNVKGHTLPLQTNNIFNIALLENWKYSTLIIFISRENMEGFYSLKIYAHFIWKPVN